MNKKWFAAFCMLAFGICLFTIWQFGYTEGYQEGYNAFTPRTIIQEVQLPPEKIIINTETVREVPVIQEVEVVKKIYQVQPLANFDNVTQLQAVMGSFLLLGNETWDCDDFAYHFQVLLAKNGYYSSVQYLRDKSHMINSVKIGNELWYIEPQDKTFWKVTELD